MSSYPQAIRVVPARAPSTAAIKLPAALLLPSFGVVVFAVALLEVLFLAPGAPGLFRDSDTGWHVRNGEAILQSFTLPRIDSFSYTRAGQQWLAWEWLSDAVLAGVHQLAGLRGVALLAAFVIAFTAWAVARLALSWGANLFFAAGAAALLLGTTSMHWLARPHLFSWLFALAFLAVAERERRGKSRALFVLPLLACLWANMHGSFLLGPAILFVYAIGESIIRKQTQTGWFSDCPFPRLASASLLSLIATFINPYGWRLHEHVIGYLQNDYLMDRISEFRSFSFHSPGAYHIEIFLFVAIIGIVAMLRQGAYAPALLGVGMVHMSLYAARHFPLAAVLLLPLASAALTREARSSRRLFRFLDYSDRVQAMDRRMWGLVPLAAIVVIAVLGVGSVDFDPKVFPVQAAAFLERNGLTARAFASDHWGGYLIYRFAGRTKVFVDGRSDFYGQQLLEAYARVLEVKPGWNQVFEQYDVGLVLIPPDHALAAVLQLSPGWRRIYSDSVALIFEREG